MFCVQKDKDTEEKNDTEGNQEKNNAIMEKKDSRKERNKEFSFQDWNIALLWDSIKVINIMLLKLMTLTISSKIIIYWRLDLIIFLMRLHNKSQICLKKIPLSIFFIYI